MRYLDYFYRFFVYLIFGVFFLKSLFLFFPMIHIPSAVVVKYPLNHHTQMSDLILGHFFRSDLKSFVKKCDLHAKKRRRIRLTQIASESPLANVNPMLQNTFLVY